MGGTPALSAIAGLAHGALKVFTWLTDAKASNARLDMFTIIES